MNCSAVKRYLAATLDPRVRLAKLRNPFLFLPMLVAALFASQAHAQCYGFNGTTAQAVLSITNLPTPSVASYGSGGYIYTYSFTTPMTGNSVTYSSGGTVQTTTSFGGQIVAASAPSGSASSVFSLLLEDVSGTFYVLISLESYTLNLFPSGLPPVFPKAVWGAYNQLGSGTMVSANSACSLPPPDGTIGYCSVCNGGSGHPGGPTGAEPITISTGSVFEAKTDYTTAGPNPLSFTRTYNSMYSANGSFAGIMGNWRTPYDSYLHISPATSPTTVIAERADGLMLTFTGSGSTWTPATTDIDYTLTHSGSTWTLTDHNDTVEAYHDAGTGEGLLQTITLRNGYAQTVTYSSGLLSSVTDSYGRSFAFTYSGGLLTNITTPDSATGITYGYNSNGALTTVMYPTTPSSTLIYVYGNASLPLGLTGIIDEDGNTYATWSYDSSGRAISNQMGGNLAANVTTLSYGTGTTTLTNAFGVADTYTFTTLQNVPKVTQISRAATSTTAAATEKFSYDSNGYLSRTTDWLGTPTVYTNDGHGDPTTITEAPGDPVARTTTITYGAPTGACTTFIHLPCSIVTAGLTSTFTYDSHGNPLTRTDTDTTTNTIPYSTNGQTRTTTWTWSTTGQMTSVQLPRTDLTAKTTFTYTSGTLTQIQDALSHQTNITSYSSGGRPLTIVDPNSVTTTLTYDARQNLNTSTLHTGAGNLTTTWTLDPALNLTAVQLPDGSKTTYSYDAAHRRTGVTDLLGNTIAYTLDALGDITQERAKTSTATVTYQDTLSYDSLGRQIKDTNGVSATTTFSYDPNGNMLTVAPPSPSGTITYAYDALNRFFTRTDPSSTGSGVTTAQYDAHDRMLSIQDPNGKTTAYTYNGFGDRTQIASPDSGTTVAYYNGDGDLTQQIRPGPQTANMTYDAKDRLLTTSYPSDSSLNVSRTYDQTGHGFGVGHLTGATDQPGTLSLTYDERGNVTNESRTVTSLGTLTTATTFDNASRVASITYPSSTLVTYTRDSMGQVSGITAKPPGASSASSVASSIVYQPPTYPGGLGKEPWTLIYGNGITGAYQRDLANRPTTHIDTTTSSSYANYLSYSYYANDNLLSISDHVNTSNTQNFSYDSLNRLISSASQQTSATSACDITGDTTPSVADVQAEINEALGFAPARNDLNGDGVVNVADVQIVINAALGLGCLASSTIPLTGGYGNYSWTWDANSNLTGQTINGTATTFAITSGSNQLGSITPSGGTATTVTSSPTGNISALTLGTSTELSMTYNQANQVGAVSTPVSSATYKYDLRGLRLEKALPGRYPVLYQYSRQGGELLSETDLHSGQTADYIYLDPGRNSLPIGEVNPTSGALYFMHTDRLGTVDMVTDATQTNVWNAIYNPFGDIPIGGVTGTLATQSLRLPGQYFDPETGNNHNGYRDYNGAFTRYLQSDPIGLSGGINTYQYVRGNPISFTDPDGRQVREGIAIAIVAVAVYESIWGDYTFLSNFNISPPPTTPFWDTPNTCTRDNPNGYSTLIAGPSQFLPYTSLPEQHEPPEFEVPEFPERPEIPRWSGTGPYYPSPTGR